MGRGRGTIVICFCRTRQFSNSLPAMSRCRHPTKWGVEGACPPPNMRLSLSLVPQWWKLVPVFGFHVPTHPCCACYLQFAGELSGRTGFVLQVVDEQADSEAAAAAGDAGSTLVLPGHAGDIQVRPVVLVGKFLQEGGGGDGAGRATTGVFYIGEIALDLAGVFFPQRKLPQAFATALSGFKEFIDQFVIVTENRRRLIAEGDDAGAGQGGQIDDHPGFVARYIGQGISKDEASFGIGIEYLNCL